MSKVIMKIIERLQEWRVLSIMCSLMFLSVKILPVTRICNSILQLSEDQEKAGNNASIGTGIKNKNQGKIYT